MAVKDIISQFEGSEASSSPSKKKISPLTKSKGPTFGAKETSTNEKKVETSPIPEVEQRGKGLKTNSILLPSPDLKKHIGKTDNLKYELELKRLSYQLKPDHNEMFKQIEDLLTEMKKDLKHGQKDKTDGAKETMNVNQILPLMPGKKQSRSTSILGGFGASPESMCYIPTTSSQKVEDEVSSLQSYTTACCSSISSTPKVSSKVVKPEKKHSITSEDKGVKNILIANTIEEINSAEGFETVQPIKDVEQYCIKRKESSQVSFDNTNSSDVAGKLDSKAQGLYGELTNSSPSARNADDLFEYASYNKLLETPDTSYHPDIELPEFKTIQETQTQRPTETLGSPVKFTVEVPIPNSDPPSSSYSSLGSYNFPRAESSSSHRIKHLEQTLETDVNEERKKRWYHKFHLKAKKFNMRTITQSELVFSRRASFKSKQTKKIEPGVVGHPQLQVGNEPGLGQLTRSKAGLMVSPASEHDYRQLASPSPAQEKRMSVKVSTATQTDDTDLLQNFRQLQTSILKKFSEPEQLQAVCDSEEEDPVAEFSALVQEVFSRY